MFSLRCDVNITKLHHQPQQNHCWISQHQLYPQPGGFQRSPSGDDCTGKRKIVATKNIAIKITEQLAGTAANGSAAAADEETVGAGAGQGGADAVDKSPAQDSETNLKVNFVVLEVISD